MVSPLFIFIASLASYACYVAAYAIYNLYFHPLAKYPGPKVWIAFPPLRFISANRGLLDIEIRKLHTKHGDVVRFSPNELSFITAEAWRDVYGHGHRELPKLMFGDPNQASNIVSANPADHARFRKAMSNGFSDKSLREQEPTVKIYVDLLVSKLRETAASSTPKADMLNYYNLTTFDLIGDLAFGESFDGLKEGRMHSWIANIFKSIKILPFVRTMSEYPLFAQVILWTMPSGMKEAQAQHLAYSRETAMKRANNKALHGRPDFMDSMLKHRGEKGGLTDDELAANSHILVIAGSETSATTLAAVTYFLLRDQEVMRKATAEVRTTFSSEDDIHFVSASNKLPYMAACLEEALRLFPPVPTVLQRQTVEDKTNVCGRLIPKGTIVGVHQTAAYWSTSNFHRPDEFHPERWLPESTTNEKSNFFNDHRAVVQPFSVGPRNCIGRNLAYNEMRLILSRVLWNFDLELCEESVKWNETLSFVLWEKKPLWCRLTPRPQD